MIYFIKAGDKVKIGYSNDPSMRISELQTSCPHDLEVLLIIDGGQKEERELHTRFRDLRRAGEWFQIDESIGSYIRSNAHRDRKYELGLVEADFDGNEQIRRLRQKHRITAGELAQRLNVSQQAASAMESREKNGSIAIKNMQKIAEALGYVFQYRFVPKKNKFEDGH